MTTMRRGQTQSPDSASATSTMRRGLFFLGTVLLTAVSATSPPDAPLFCAFRCVASQGFLRSAPHHRLESILTATRSDRPMILADIAFEVADALPGGWVWLRHARNQRYVRMLRPPEKPAWVVPDADARPRPEGLFRIEQLGGAWYIFSNHTGGYVNCIEGGLIRGHGYFPRNNLPATREPTTEFEIVALNASLVKESLLHPGALELRPDVAATAAQRQGQAGPGIGPAPGKQRHSRPIGGGGGGGFAAPPSTALSSSTRDERRDACKRSCRWAYDEQKGYPTTAFSGALADYVCPSMFRDLADYVFQWPFSHFKEKVTTAPPDVAASCLPPVPIIYSHAGPPIAKMAVWSKKFLRRPYILVTGQSDFPVSKAKGVLGDPNLVKWFAQNSDMNHPKLVPIPIGLNCFEHAPEMHQALRALKTSSGPPARQKLVLVNFGNTHPSRKQIWEHFCGRNSANKKFATCSIKSQRNNIQGNPHLVGFYKKVASHKFVVAPRGNGWDTHRLWEALYLGCVPIVESSVLDPLYAHLPILIVKKWAALDQSTLEQIYERFLPRLNAQERLHRPFWWAAVESARTGALQPRHRGGNASRYRCWG
jgi:hypothetical protein